MASRSRRATWACISPESDRLSTSFEDSSDFDFDNTSQAPQCCKLLAEGDGSLAIFRRWMCHDNARQHQDRSRPSPVGLPVRVCDTNRVVGVYTPAHHSDHVLGSGYQVGGWMGG